MMPAAVRRKLVQTLGLDLVGPDRDSDLLAEVLPQAPSRWYLTGFLVPIDAAEGQKIDEAATEEVDEASDAGGTDDAAIPEPAAARRAVFPSSMGLLVPREAKELRVTVRWGITFPRRNRPMPSSLTCSTRQRSRAIRGNSSARRTRRAGSGMSASRSWR
jgi:hypothetical protein